MSVCVRACDPVSQPSKPLPSRLRSISNNAAPARHERPPHNSRDYLHIVNETLSVFLCHPGTHNTHQLPYIRRSRHSTATQIIIVRAVSKANNIIINRRRKSCCSSVSVRHIRKRICTQPSNLFNYLQFVHTTHVRLRMQCSICAAPVVLHIEYCVHAVCARWCAYKVHTKLCNHA